MINYETFKSLKNETICKLIMEAEIQRIDLKQDITGIFCIRKQNFNSGRILHNSIVLLFTKQLLLSC